MRHLAAWLIIACSLCSGSPAPCQRAGTKIPDREALLAYIHNGWESLSRSMTDCKSIIDPKVNAVPLLYLPAGMALPDAVKAMQQQCHVEVRSLPRKLTRLGELKPGELKQEGLLYLPNRYVVPGGRFNEMYGWDSYFILLGLLQDGRDDLARGMVDNFVFEMGNYGGLLNANRSYFLTRSQPPLLSSMIRAVYEHTENHPLSREWLETAYTAAKKTMRCGSLRNTRRAPQASPVITILVRGRYRRWLMIASTIRTLFAGYKLIQCREASSYCRLRTLFPHSRWLILHAQAVTSGCRRFARAHTSTDPA